MANSFTQTPSDTYSPPYASLATSIARRSSYASVVSGAAGSLTPPPPSSRPAYLSHADQSISPSRLSNRAYSPQLHYHQRTTGQGRRPSTTPLHQHSGSWVPTQSEQYLSGLHYMASHDTTMFKDSRSHDFFVPSYLRGSRFAERLEDYYKVQADRDARIPKTSTNGFPPTSAGSMNIHKTVPAHRGMTLDVQEKPQRSVDDIAALPSRWDAIDKFAGIEVLAEGSEIRYSGTSKSQDEAAACRADRPIPKHTGLYYFEVNIINKSKEW